MQFLRLNYALTAVGRFFAPEVRGIYSLYKDSPHVRITQEVNKVFLHSIDLEPTCPEIAKHMKMQAAVLAPHLNKLEEFNDSKWKVHSLYITNFLLVDPGVSIALLHENGEKLRLRTSRNSWVIIRETEQGLKWCELPKKTDHDVGI